jgi:MSHA biogenesis protein MshM
LNVLAHKTLMLAYGEGEHKVRMRHAKAAAADTPAAHMPNGFFARLAFKLQR